MQKATGILTYEDLAFLTGLNSPEQGTPITQTLQQGYLRHLDRPVKLQAENIYKRVIDPSYSLCFHCSSEVMFVFTKLYKKLFDTLAAQAAAEEPAEEEQPAPKSKTSRTKKY